MRAPKTSIPDPQQSLLDESRAGAVNKSEQQIEQVAQIEQDFQHDFDLPQVQLVATLT